MNEQKPPQRTTYPLSLLFLIITGVAVLAALVGPLVRDIEWDSFVDDPAETAGMFVAAILMGILTGAVLGLFQFQRALGVLVGVLVGSLLGPFAVILSQVTVPQLIRVVPAVFIGCGILLLVAWVIRPPLPPTDEEPVRAEFAEEGARGPK